MNIDEVILNLEILGIYIRNVTNRLNHDQREAKEVIDNTVDYIKSQDQLLKKREDQLREMSKLLKSQTESNLYKLQADRILKELNNDS